MRREITVAESIDCDMCGENVKGTDLPAGWVHVRLIMRSMDICTDCSLKSTTLRAWLKQFSPEHGEI